MALVRQFSVGRHRFRSEERGFSNYVPAYIKSHPFLRFFTEFLVWFGAQMVLLRSSDDITKAFCGACVGE